MSKLPNALQFIFELIQRCAGVSQVSPASPPTLSMWSSISTNAQYVIQHLHQRSVCDPPLEIFHEVHESKTSNLTRRQQMGPWKQNRHTFEGAPGLSGWIAISSLPLTSSPSFSFMGGVGKISATKNLDVRNIFAYSHNECVLVEKLLGTPVLKGSMGPLSYESVFRFWASCSSPTTMIVAIDVGPFGNLHYLVLSLSPPSSWVRARGTPHAFPQVWVLRVPSKISSFKLRKK